MSFSVPWVRLRKQKAAIKLHTLLDLRGFVPVFIRISDRKMHDVNILDELPREPGSYYIMDRGYIDFSLLYILTQFSTYFVTCAKANLKYRRLYSHRVDKSFGLKCDQTNILTGYYSSIHYPEKLRRTRYHDAQTDRLLTFLLNNFILPALIIAKLCKCRWQVELFFRWIKQHLSVTAFKQLPIIQVPTNFNYRSPDGDSAKTSSLK